MSKNRTLVMGILIAGAAIAGDRAQAAEVSASGKNMFVNKVLESVKLADGTTAIRVLSDGFMSTEDAGNPLSLASMNCSGTTVRRGEATVSGAGSCESLDLDGDVAFYWWRYDEKAGGRWGFLGGTGKWSGVEGGGTYTPAFAWKDGKNGNTWKGTWKTK